MNNENEQYIERKTIVVPEEIIARHLGTRTRRPGGLQDLAVQPFLRELAMQKVMRSDNDELKKHFELCIIKYRSVLDPDGPAVEFLKPNFKA